MTDRVSKTIQTADGAMPVTVGTPECPPRGAVIVLHQAGGMSAQIEGWVDLMSSQGYMAVAPELFYRKGVATADFSQFGGDMQQIDLWLGGDDLLESDIAAVIYDLVAQGFEHSSIGCVGFSYGGRAAFLTAVTQTLGACVSWYGNGIAHRSFTHNPKLDTLVDRPLRTPWLGLFGEADGLISPDELAEIRATLDQQNVDHGVVSYPGVGHGFDVEHPAPGRPSNYDAVAATDGLERTEAFLAQHLHA